MMTRLILSVLFLISFLSCSVESDVHEEPSVEREHLESSEQQEKKELDTIKFTEQNITALYDSLNTQFEVEFELDDLKSLFGLVDPVQLAQGKEFYYKFLIEDFDCDCFDQLKIAYDDSSESFSLVLYTELYVEDLDWCPEHTIGYGFDLKEGEISNTQVLFEAG